jgi:hypothetical protein
MAGEHGETYRSPRHDTSPSPSSRSRLDPSPKPRRSETYAEISPSPRGPSLLRRSETLTGDDGSVIYKYKTPSTKRGGITVSPSFN